MVRLKDQSLTQAMADHVRWRVRTQKKSQLNAPPLQVTQKGVVKEKEPIMAPVNTTNRASSLSTPPRCRPWTRSMTQARARWLGTLIRFRNLNEVLVKADSSDDEASYVQVLGATLVPEHCHHCNPINILCLWQIMMSEIASLMKVQIFPTWLKKLVTRSAFWNLDIRKF